MKFILLFLLFTYSSSSCVQQCIPIPFERLSIDGTPIANPTTPPTTLSSPKTLTSEPTTASPTTGQPTTASPTTAAPTTAAPTTGQPTLTCVNDWVQCGGINLFGEDVQYFSCCTVGFDCVRANPWFWQCRT
jgi:hypothetical protein